MYFLKGILFVLLVLQIGSNNKDTQVHINSDALNHTRLEQAAVIRVAYKEPLYASPDYNKAYARQTMASEYNWGSKQFNCLVKLWNKESMWRVDADNPHSSAYGIPQALPGSKMGEGWQDDPHVQINWGLKYIEDRYNTPCGAWSAFNKKGWY